MEISILLIQKIASMFLMMFMGLLLVKLKILKSTSSEVLSKLTLYIIIPCALIDGMHIERTPDRVSGLLLALFAAVLVHIVIIPVVRLLCRPMKLSRVEEGASIFSNGGGLIMPIVAYCLGSEWVIYVSAFMLTQLVLNWTYTRIRFSGEKKIEWKKILLNSNIIVAAVGLIIFFGNIRLPRILAETISSFSLAVGPFTMLCLGMLLAEVEFKELYNKRVFLVCFLRLVLLPLIVVLLFTITGLTKIHPQAESILLISLLSASAPVGTTIMQMAQLFDREASYAGVLTTTSVLLCIFTMPIITSLYQMLL